MLWVSWWVKVERGPGNGGSQSGEGVEFAVLACTRIFLTTGERDGGAQQRGS